MKSILTFILFFLYLQGFAQSPDYYVHLVSGDATITRTGKKPVAIQQKQLVYKRDVFTLKKGAEITLVDTTGGFFVINTAGANTLSSLLAKAVRKNNDGITTKYLKLLFHELLDPSQDFEKLKKENIAGVWGGVSRSDECGNRIFPVNGLQTSASSLVFKWHTTSPSADYTFVIYNTAGNELVKINAKDTFQFVSLNETLKGQPGKYFWRVTSHDGTCEDEVPIYFNILTQEQEQKLVEQLIAGANSESLEMQLQQIDKLEKNALINAASSRYAALVNASPGNKALLKSYVLFLLKYGFDEEARAAWKR